MRRSTSHGTFSRAAVSAASVLLLAACGGGGGGAGPGGPAPTALLQGRVLSLDGSSAAVAGLLLEDTRTGETVSTAEDGSFDFGDVPAGTAAVWVTDPASPAPGAGDLDDDRSNPLAGMGFFVEAVEGETVLVEVAIADGAIAYLGVAGSADGWSAATVPLERAETCDDPDAEGVATLSIDESGIQLDVEVFGFASGRDLDAVVGGALSLGIATVDADGEATWVLDEAAVKPAGSGAGPDLSGLGIEVLDATTGTLLLVGKAADSVPPPFGSGDAGSYGADRLLPEGDATVLGVVEVESRTDEPREVLRVAVVEAAPAAVLEVLLDSAPGGPLATIGTITAAADGSGTLEIDTQDGDVLPFGVAGVADLVGREIVVRDAATLVVLLRGRIPELLPLGW